MYGYIYKTINLITGDAYIGQKKSDYFVKTYYGSGSEIKKQLKEYGTLAFEHEMIAKANSREELDELEIYYIQMAKREYGEKCLNLARGGTGGHPLWYASDEQIEEFVKRMQEINRARCRTEEYRKYCSKRMKELFSDPEKRKEHSKRIRKAWSDEKLKESQSKRLKEYYSNHVKDNSYNFKPCAFKLGLVYKEFESVADLRKFLIDQYNYNPDRRTFKTLMKNGGEGIEYHPFHKNNTKLMELDGMLIYYL